MTIEELRALAGYHVEAADAARRMAKGMGNCSVAEKAKATAAFHDQWAEKLTALADSFYAFTSSQ